MLDSLVLVQAARRARPATYTLLYPGPALRRRQLIPQRVLATLVTRVTDCHVHSSRAVEDITGVGPTAYPARSVISMLVC